MKKHNKKTLALSIVAFILVLMSLISFTFSWIDDIKLVEFQNDDLAKNGAPLKTGTDINAAVNITKTDNTIDLGNMLTNSDLTYEYQEGSETKKHIKYDTSSPDATKNPDTDDINEKKGYFYESGDMHLSGCYSDGEKFYFPRQGQSGYREGNKDDENVNYISFTVKVSSPNATTDFWFRNEPAIYKSGTNTKIANARYAIIVDGQAHVYSSTGTANTCNSGLTGTTAVQGVRKTSTYTYNHADNTTSERGKNSNTLFSIKKGDTVNMTVKIWLENGFDATITASDINLQLVSSWAYTRKLWIEDKTTNGGGGSWLNDASAKLYATFPEILYDMNSTVSNWPNLAITDNGPFYELQTSNSKYYVEVPLVYNLEKMILYRCNSSGWNNAGSSAAQRSEYNVYCWNWWRTYTPNTYVDETYTLYGGSLDITAKGYFGNDMGNINDPTYGNRGYGTWGAVEELKVYSFYNGTDLATKGSAMYVVDYSDEAASGETYIYEMYRNGTTSSDPWKTYAPATSSKIQFRYFGGNKPRWGYNSWGGANPQRRPLASTGLYPANADTYNLGAIFNNTNGWGFWSQGNNQYDRVYLVKNNIFAYENNVYANLYDDNSHGNAVWPGVQMTRMTNASGGNVTWKDNASPVYVSDPARTGASVIYNHLRFNNGDSNFDNAVKTNVLDVFPGCFYNPADGKWYGTINDTGRDASSSSGGGSGGGSSTGGGGTIEGFTIESDFTIQANGNTYTVYQNSSGTEFKARVALTTGSNANWTTVQKNGTDYGLEQSGQSYSVPSDTINLYLVSGRRNNFRLNASSAGNYIITFEYDNGNTGTIRVSSVLLEN